MINVSNEFKDKMTNDDRNFLAYIKITLRDGTVLDLDNSDLWENSLKISDGVTASGEFTVGSCIVGKLTFTLNNIYDNFSAYDFDRATINLSIGLRLTDGKIEKIPKGIFVVDEPSYDGTTITLECLDNMSRMDVDYSEVKTAYPTTVGEIVNDICRHCGIGLVNANFPNRGYIVKGRPEDDALTCRQVLAYCAQLACCFGKCDGYGKLDIRWFAQGIFEKNDNLDGGILDDGMPQYASGDTADGGNFEDYSGGDSFDGGLFEDLDAFHHLHSMSSFNISTDDVVITGVQVTEEFTETENDKKQTATVGTAGYVLSIAGNRFVQKGTAKTVAQYLGSKLIGLRFRPVSVQVLGDPTVESGDLAYVTDRRQNTYNCLVTNNTFNLGGFMEVSCDAKTPEKNSSKQYSELTKAIVEIRKEAQRQASSLATVMSQAFGVFKTEEAQEDGSIIYYMHDKPTLAQSMTIWKFTAGAFAVSTDGGKTWNAGLDASGNATVNILSAIGINCDWIHSGTLTLGGIGNINGVLKIVDASGAVVGRWDKDGVVLKKGDISGTSVTVGGVNNQSGVLKILDQSNTEIGKWDKDGIKITKGSLSGTTITLGGENNQNGMAKVLDSAGNEIVRLDRNGVYAKGKYVCASDRYGRSIEISDGEFKVLAADGSIAGRIIATSNSWVRIDAGDGVDVRMLGDMGYFCIDAKSFEVDGALGKSGRAEFSDGSYLDFHCGILSGGNTTEGGAF